MTDTHRFWMFTWNNYDGMPALMDFKYGRYMVWQEELGENGTPHIQGYLELTRGVRMSALRAVLPRAHWSVRLKDQQTCIAYCTKEDTRQAGPYHEGTPTGGQGKRNDIHDAYVDLRAGKTLEDILANHTAVFFKYQRGLMAAKLILEKPRDSSRDKKVLYFYGPPGVGKSRLAAEMAPLAFRKQPNSKWWDGYDGELDVIFDDLTSGWFTWSNLMQVLDRYGTSVETKGGSRQLLADRIIITSNKRPWELYKTEDGVSRHPIGALLRRITDYLEFSQDGTYVNHGTLDPNANMGLPDLLNRN